MSGDARGFDPDGHRISAVVWARLGLVLVDGLLLIPRLIGAALSARNRRERLRDLLRDAADEPLPRNHGHAQENPDRP